MIKSHETGRRARTAAQSYFLAQKAAASARESRKLGSRASTAGASRSGAAHAPRSPARILRFPPTACRRKSGPGIREQPAGGWRACPQTARSRVQRPESREGGCGGATAPHQFPGGRQQEQVDHEKATDHPCAEQAIRRNVQLWASIGHVQRLLCCRLFVLRDVRGRSGTSCGPPNWADIEVISADFI